MNRIYQGRVTKVERLFAPRDEEGNGPRTARKDTKPEWEEMEDGEAALWRHHEEFQDAVNSND